ncbi:MAG: hypothetical protein IPK53_18270 [bacterium]|nr:hypothetical protein [bacterium]
MYSKSVLMSGLLALVFSIAGCETDRGTAPYPEDKPVGSIQIAVQDTIEFLPADSASALVVVIVSDPQGMVMPEVK